MIEYFKEFVEKHRLVEPGQRSLLAVSGGVDSVVMCYLYQQAGFPFAIAHCNFQLRGDESDKDEQFVFDLASQLGTQCYKIKFDTKNISEKEKTSIQLTARKLRYQWLDKIASQHGFHKIGTAHHLNDRLETFLYNFTKGTGIRGLRSIPIQSGNIIRPLLFAAKADILAFAKKHSIVFREDASNLSVKYNRNKIRKEIIPVLSSINPTLETTAYQTFQNLEDTERLYLWAIQQHRQQLFRQENDKTTIDLQGLLAAPAPQTLLYELIAPFGFSADQARQILDKNTRRSGASFYSSTHQLVTHRDVLMILPLQEKQDIYIHIHESDHTVTTPFFNITITKTNDLPSTFDPDPNIAWLDSDKLSFPLLLRNWKEGDYFCPLGMKGHRKKVKKFLIDQKVALPDKDKVCVLLSGDRICWVVGMRVDERFATGRYTVHGTRYTVIRSTGILEVKT